MASIGLGFHLHRATAFSVQPSNASTKPHRHCPPQRIHAAGRRCLLRAKSSNGHPQIGASFSDGVLDGNSSGARAVVPEQGENTVSITMVGASGDLAKKKIFPALFALFYEDWLPKHFTVFGYARSKMSNEELRNMISMTLTCRVDQRENCSDKMDQFLKRCFYQSGQYNSEEGFCELDRKLTEKEAGKLPNRLFYLSIPPNIFVDVVSYFDNYGIIRDIMQNHLLQILALFAMETPVSLAAEDIRNEKVKSYPAYVDDPTVPNGSVTLTIAAAALFIDNARWDDVPFLMKAGQFRRVPGNLYRGNVGTDLDMATNELVLRVQPDEAIYLKINNKVPGLGMRLDSSNLNLFYSETYQREIPDAYERLLLDAIEGERRLFIRSDELDAAWAIFTPVLKELEEKRVALELYPYGSRGPVGALYLAANYNVRWGDISSDGSF
ncbi:unnamed protein product [Alopecurus aequalis]